MLISVFYCSKIAKIVRRPFILIFTLLVASHWTTCQLVCSGSNCVKKFPKIFDYFFIFCTCYKGNLFMSRFYCSTIVTAGNNKDIIEYMKIDVYFSSITNHLLVFIIILCSRSPLQWKLYPDQLYWRFIRKWSTLYWKT